MSWVDITWTEAEDYFPSVKMPYTQRGMYNPTNSDIHKEIKCKLYSPDTISDAPFTLLCLKETGLFGFTPKEEDFKNTRHIDGRYILKEYGRAKTIINGRNADCVSSVIALDVTNVKNDKYREVEIQEEIENLVEPVQGTKEHLMYYSNRMTTDVKFKSKKYALYVVKKCIKK